jgi:hypothetical protein
MASTLAVNPVLHLTWIPLILPKMAGLATIGHRTSVLTLHEMEPEDEHDD